MYSEENRVNLIRDNLIGHVHWLGEEKSFLYPVMDLVTILVQRPLAFSFWVIKNDELIPVFCSWPNDYPLTRYSTDLLKSYLVPIDEERIWMLVERFNGQKLELDADIYRCVRQLFDQSYVEQKELFKNERVWKLFLDRLGKSIKSQKRPQYDKKPPTKSEFVNHEDLNKLFEPMDNVLERAYESFRSSPYLNFNLRNQSEKESKFLNLFSLIRCSGKTSIEFQDSSLCAMLRFDPKQRFLLDDWAKIEKTYKLPSLSAPAISFRTGIVSIYEMSNDIAEKNGKLGIEFSKEVERKLLQSGLVNTLFIPIHVGGVCWLLLFTRTSSRTSDDWQSNYHLYRDVIPKVADQIRKETEEAFTELVKRAILFRLQSMYIHPQAIIPSDLGRRVSADWELIARVYPFDILELKPCKHTIKRSDNSRIIEIPGRAILEITGQDNPFFEKQVGFGLLNYEEVLYACRTAVKEYLDTVSASEQRERAYSTHLLETPLNSIEIGAEKIEDEEVKVRIIANIKDLSRLMFFSACWWDKRKRERYKQDKLNKTDPQTFFQMLNKIITKTIDVLKSNYFDDSKYVRKWHKDGLIEIQVAMPFEYQFSESIAYYVEQIETVAHGLIRNAASYTPKTRCGGSSRMKISIDVDDEGKIFIVVENVTGRRDNLLSDLVEKLNGESPDLIGISTIKLANQVCGYLPPSWSANEGESLLAKAQIGIIIGDVPR